MHLRNLFMVNAVMLLLFSAAMVFAEEVIT